jgi:glycosyltransferase involved in cell wall biosynthesis
MVARFVGTFREKLVIFHVLDNYVDFFEPNAIALRKAMAENEVALMKRTDLIFAVSQALSERCLEYNPRTFIAPNGVDYELFQAAMANGKIPPDMRSIPKPIIGYVGAIQSYMDFPLLQQVSENHPEWSLVLVGPEELGSARPKLDRLLTKPNVYYLGCKSFREVPNYIKCCDVCIMPHQVNELTVSADMIKVYEYLACGRPVVSMDIPCVRRFSPLVEIAEDAAEFGRCVEKCLSEGPDMVRRRIAAAREHSWQRRVEGMSQVIRQQLSGGGDTQHCRPPSYLSGTAL